VVVSGYRGGCRCPGGKIDQFGDVKKSADDDRAMIAEFRSNGGQSIIPPSLHESGEFYRWEKDGEPAIVDALELLNRVAQLSAHALLARYWRTANDRRWL